MEPRLENAFNKWPNLSLKKILNAARVLAQLVTNTRAVPLVRKDDAHQGRVSFYLSDSLLCHSCQPNSSSQNPLSKSINIEINKNLSIVDFI
jgi:hypothetical protein